MQPTPRHATVESRFRELIDTADLQPPDRVRYDPEAVVFIWDDQQLAVCVDFDDSLPPAA